ncbi:MAG: chlorite dismutase [Nitrospinaceae bacterium]|nr:chlorite dismutase [Nitrospinaceae bacterium]NIR57222.1 chlorite dismutase [Nitrospinaceae bacterium]NIS87670.1 chlorite dismutase [Nitrospinaceae bacterium]NIT84536.1 chlorite dismutase [Nitrospinaceae bacterium]NIU46722.1 chlorite dismutase [Nitrospinaceae bacterium]
MAIDDKELDEMMPATELDWTEDARARMLNVPFFVRKSVVRGIEQYAKDKNIELIDDDVVSRARQEREADAIAESRRKKQAQEQTETGEEKKVPRQFVNFSFFKLDPAYRRLPQKEIDKGKKEFLEVLEEYDSRDDIILLSYTTMGIRADAELMFWRVSYKMELFQEMTTKLYRTGLGKYLQQTYSYFSQTKKSMYMDIFNPEHEEDRTHIIPGKAKYLFIYPFTKKREWYLLTKFTRQGIMDEHIFVGNKYPSVKLNTTYSFGIDDYEFVVAFETDYPDDFVDLVMDLRETEGSRYTLEDTPIFSCTAMSLEDAVNALGI